MSNLNEGIILERLSEELIAQDNKGLLDDEVQTIAEFYSLHEDDDRDEIINFIAEGIYYNYYS
mgnify:CR=1 FL=1|jgi:hypothetical protein|tara:strand:- start:219 stop:407 length:189 start_codon:yes stop_codon:yes gene_type:complete